jgi:hypothetical protein
MADDSKIEKARSSEANVLIEFQMVDPMSEEVLDANSDDVLEAVENGAAKIALGPAIAINLESCAIKLRFDVLAENDACVHQRIAEVIEIILRDTALELHVSRSEVEAAREAEEQQTGELVPV